MKKIPLSQGKVALVDDEDFERVMRAGPWCACRHHSTHYAVSGRNGYMHRWLMGAVRGQIVDHANHEGLDNRRSVNIRFVTDSQNRWNRRGAAAHSRLGIRGVSTTSNGKFFSRITVNRKVMYLGYFQTVAEAGAAYEKANVKYFGKFGGQFAALKAVGGLP